VQSDTWRIQVRPAVAATHPHLQHLSAEKEGGRGAKGTKMTQATPEWKKFSSMALLLRPPTNYDRKQSAHPMHCDLDASRSCCSRDNCCVVSIATDHMSL